MENIKIETFNLIGISVRTSNQNGQGAKDIGALWQRFMSENLSAQIPNKLGEAIYSMYTDYEGDHTQPYTTIIGCKVKHLESIPEGMIGKTTEGGSYVKTTAKGDLMQGIVVQEWMKVWNTDLDRRYTGDFEIYDERAQNPSDAEVDLFIAVK